MAELDPEDVSHLVRLHRDHHARTPASQRVLNRITLALARPTAVSLTVLVVTAWIAGNAWAPRFHLAVLDKTPYPDLSLALTVIAVVVALLILSTQRFDSQLAERRAELTLQIALLSERKVAKLIELMEEQRRDNPLLRNRVDPELEELRRRSDPMEELERIEADRAGSEELQA